MHRISKSNSPEDSRAFLADHTIKSNFDSLSVIGDGTYGVVYKAREKSTGKYVALKRTRISFTENGIPVSAMREITTLKYLHHHDHPNVVKLLDICQGSSEGSCMMLFMIFEHLDQNLAVYIEDHDLVIESKIKHLLKQLLNGLDFLHSHRVIHRDLKPQNILISDMCQLKIADFGLAKIYDNEMKLTSVVQTLWYRAPEVIFGIQYATAIDIWAAGCIMVEMALRRPLFLGTSEVDQLNRIFSVIGTPSESQWPSNVSLFRNAFRDWPPVDLEELIPQFSANERNLLSEMLHFNPKDRVTAQDALRHPYFQE